MPGIMQQIIMRLLSDLPDLVNKYGEEVRKDVKQIVDAVERLKMELNRDRQFLLFHGAEPDKVEWNAFITEMPRPKSPFFAPVGFMPSATCTGESFPSSKTVATCRNTTASIT